MRREEICTVGPNWRLGLCGIVRTIPNGFKIRSVRQNVHHKREFAFRVAILGVGISPQQRDRLDFVEAIRASRARC